MDVAVVQLLAGYVVTIADYIPDTLNKNLVQVFQLAAVLFVVGFIKKIVRVVLRSS